MIEYKIISTLENTTEEVEKKLEEFRNQGYSIVACTSTYILLEARFYKNE